MKTKLVYLLLLSVLSTASASEILMRFWANKDYVRPIGTDGRPALETYTFYIGKYYPGVLDAEEDAIPFETVARILVEELATQNYQMAEDPLKADTILVINWGQTSPENETEEFEFISSSEDTGEEEIFTSEEVPEHKQREYAKLIGATKLYNMHAYSLKKRLLQEAIVQDRYFINIYAVSILALKSRPSKDEKIQTIWECQLSVPIDQDDPATAFRAMAQTGRSYFGKNVKNVTFMEDGIKQGVATIGEIRFLDTEEDVPTDTTEE